MQNIIASAARSTIIIQVTSIAETLVNVFYQGGLETHLQIPLGKSDLHKSSLFVQFNSHGFQSLSVF